MPVHHLLELINSLPAVATHFLDDGHAAGHVVTESHHTDHGSHTGDVADSTDDPSLATGDDKTHEIDKELQQLSGGAVRVDLLNNNNSQYYGDFALGDGSKQRFTAIFDTGSGTTWVPGGKCTSDTCSEHHRFTPHESKSFVSNTDKDSTGSIHYGTGEVKYESGNDTLSFCDSHDNAGCHGDQTHHLKVPKQPFGMSTEQTTYPFRILPFDGILGLSPSVNEGSVLHQLKAAKTLGRNMLGVYLSEDTHRSGSVDFGGIEPAHIAPNNPVHWHPIRTPSEWQVSMKDILVNGKPLHLCDKHKDGVCSAVVDTGSSLITGPSGEVEKLLSKIRTNDNCGNLEKMPEVSIQLQDADGHTASYPLTPNEYTLRSLEEVPNTGDAGYFKEFPILGRGAKAPEVTSHCEPGLGVMDVPGHKWVLGNTFLRRYYSIYDDDRGQVGFVRSIHPDETATPSGSGTEPVPADKLPAAKAGISAFLGLFRPPSPSSRRSCSAAVGTNAPKAGRSFGDGRQNARRRLGHDTEDATRRCSCTADFL